MGKKKTNKSDPPKKEEEKKEEIPQPEPKKVEEEKQIIKASGKQMYTKVKEDFIQVIYNGEIIEIAQYDVDSLNLSHKNLGLPIILGPRPGQDKEGKDIIIFSELEDFDILDLCYCPKCNAQGYNKKYFREVSNNFFCFNCGLEVEPKDFQVVSDSALKLKSPNFEKKKGK